MATAEAPANLKLTPLGDRVVVQPQGREETTKSGIVLPDTAKEKPQEGEIIAVGSGARDESGKLVPLDVKAGDRILFGKWSGTEIKLDGEEHMILREEEILAVLEDCPRLRNLAGPWSFWRGNPFDAASRREQTTLARGQRVWRTRFVLT